MSIEKMNVRNWVIALIIIAFAALRTLSPDKFGMWANFTPVGAIALFGGVYLKDRWKAFLIPIVVLFVADIFINYSFFGKFVFFYEGIFWVYLSFAFIVLVGIYVKKVSPSTILISAIATVFIHWIIADIGVWLNNPIFAQNPSGFMECLLAAVPFEKNFLFGTLMYSAVMFGGFEYAKHKIPSLALA